MDNNGHPPQLPFPSLDIDRVLNSVSGLVTPPKATTTSAGDKDSPATQAQENAAHTTAGGWLRLCNNFLWPVKINLDQIIRRLVIPVIQATLVTPPV